MTFVKLPKLSTLALTTGLALSLSSCSTSFFADNSNLCIGDNGIYQRCGGSSANTESALDNAKSKGSLGTQVHHLLPEYVEQLAMDLVSNLRQPDRGSAIAITSFVSFDTDLRQGDLLGNQLSELLYSQLQLFDINLIDYNVRDYIEATPSGAFTLSREYDGYEDLSFDYVLTGTWLRANKGIIVNARIVGLYNKKVITTGSILIPNFVLPADYH